MTNTAVRLDYRGLGLQRKMILKAEAIMLAENNNVKFAVATIHPDNKVSLHNFTSIGYEIIAEKEMYHGKRRYIVIKKINWRNKQICVKIWRNVKRKTNPLEKQNLKPEKSLNKEQSN